MKRCALTAVVGVVTACGNAHLAADPRDGSREMADAFDDAGEASRDGSDVASDSGNAPRDGPYGEGDSVTDCAGAGVPPSTLACTGLYSDIATKTLAPGVQFYLPAVVLWADNAQKTRWIQLPPGTRIDASDPNEWIFPVGTKVWKEFSKGGKRVETRLFQKIDSGPPPYWVHATYAWNADESAAVTSGGGDIPLGSDGGTYHIPTFGECDKCHNGRTDHILGFEQVALGLQDAQGLTLTELAKGGLISPLPQQTQLTIGDDGTGAAAPALAWLHINCGVSCHNGNSNASCYGAGMRLRLDPTLLDGRPPTVSEFDALQTTLGVAARTPGWVQPTHWTRIVPGDSSHSLLVQLISNRGTNNPAGGQMPPIASTIVDTDDVAKVVEWIDKIPSAPAIDAGSDGSLDATVGDAAIGDASDGAFVEGG
jgi:hypothetical protein